MRKPIIVTVLFAVLASGCSHGGGNSSLLPGGGTSMTPPVTPQSVSPGTITAPAMAQTTILPASAMKSPPHSDIAQPPLSWTPIPGSASQVAASPDGSLWVLSDQPSGADKYIWHYASGAWTNISGLASNISVAADGSLWAINSGGGIYHYVSGTWTSPGGGASNTITADSSGGVYVLSNGGAGPDRAIWHYSSGTGWVQQSGAGTALAANWDTNNFPLGSVGSGTVKAGGVYILNSLGAIWYENSDQTFAQIPGAASAITPTTNGGFFVLGFPVSAGGNAIYYFDLNSPGFNAQAGAGLQSISAGSNLYLTSSSGSIFSAPLPANGPVATASMTSSGLAYTSVTIGTPKTITINVVEKDANGKTISGTYANPVTLTNLDANTSSLNTTTVSSSSTTVTLTYNGNSQFVGTRIRALINSGTLVAGSFLVTPSSCTLGSGVNRAGLYPCDLQSAYNLTASSASSGGTQTVALVDAYDDPTAESDLAVYRAAFGLSACTTANGCFKKRAQDGSTNYPIGDAGWAGEISLDLDMVSAICPNCKILLVEATDNSDIALYTAENQAVTLGATEISNSWGGPERSGILGSEAFFNHPGIPITVSTGDAGFPDGVEYPSSSQYVTAVGGTTLSTATGVRGWSEAAWGIGPGTANGGAGSGCSLFITKPSWQHDTGCSKRIVADVSAVADPATAVWTYDTYQSSGWGRVGGTSAASPIIASVYALSGNASTINNGSYPYAHTGSLNDVTTGNNSFGLGCAPNPDYFCTAEVGYDGPTGLGTPNGASGAFIRPMRETGPEPLNGFNLHPGPTRKLCPDEFRPGHARCFAIERTD